MLDGVELVGKEDWPQFLVGVEEALDGRPGRKQFGRPPPW